jgi:hypothetical protein
MKKYNDSPVKNNAGLSICIFLPKNIDSGRTLKMNADSSARYSLFVSRCTIRYVISKVSTVNNIMIILATHNFHPKIAKNISNSHIDSGVSPSLKLHFWYGSPK